MTKRTSPVLLGLAIALAILTASLLFYEHALSSHRPECEQAIDERTKISHPVPEIRELMILNCMENFGE
jgi:hypothetical protein